MDYGKVVGSNTMNLETIKAIAIISDTIIHHKTDCFIPVNKTTYAILLCFMRLKKILINSTLYINSKNNSNLSRKMNIIIKYHPFTKQALIKKLIIFSTPSKKIYVSLNDLKVFSNPHRFIVNTSFGIILGSEAIRLQIGGILLLKIII